MADIIGVGALNLDLIYEVATLDQVRVPGLPLEEGGELVGNDAQRKLLKEALEHYGVLRAVSAGGSASNSCHVLSLMGFSTGLVGVLGEDEEAQRYLAGLGAVDTCGVVRRGRTGCAYIINAEQGDRSIVVFPGSASDIAPSDLAMDALAGAAWVHMSSYTSDSGVETQRALKGLLAGRARFSIDPGEIYARKGAVALPLIEGSEVLFITERELAMLFGFGWDDAADHVLGHAKMVVVKKGREGATLLTPGGSIDMPAEAVGPVDTTGAGDVLDGVFIGLCLRGAAPEAALRTAVRAAGRSIGGYGRQAYPGKRDIEVLYEAVLVHDGKG